TSQKEEGEKDPFKAISEALELDSDSGFRLGRKTKIPVAIVVSKFDELRPNGQPLPGLDPSVFYDHVHSQGFDKQAVDETSDHLCQFLHAYGFNGVLQTLNEYKNWKLFGMAALGHAPDENNHLPSIDPINIADPLLWILYKLGHITAKKEKK
ncbi:MAG: hypothetical protein K6C40_04970, partial [Thermoguttaceae bacterium]|nr:hypothetical protein [Thermoguttaceae bacterium]